jgi:site-specific recombinase XerD
MFLIKDNSSPYFQIVYYVDGKRTKKSTKKKSKEDAVKVLKQFRSESNTLNEKYIITLNTFREEYFKYIRQSKSKSYAESIEYSFSQLLSFVGNIPIQNITKKISDQFVTFIYARSKSASNLYYRTLKAAFTKAVVWEYISDNPFAKIKAPKVPKCYPVYISEAELILILNKTEHQLFKDIFTTAFYSGMRLGELLNLQWHWIDFTSKIITVKNSKAFSTKNKRDRIIPIHPKINRILKILFRKQLQNKYVFCRYEGVKLNEDYVSKQFKKAVRASGVNEKVHFHSLRHSFCSALVQRGVSLYTVKELVGHENIKTTQIYSHLQKQNLSQAVNLL